MGVTVTVPEIGMALVLVATKFRLPMPDAPRPMDVLLLVQLYTVPATGPVKFTVKVAPAHTRWSATGFTDGTGLTVIVKVTGVPEQLTPPLVYTGVTVIVATCGTLVTLVAIKLGIFPSAPAPRPMLVLLLVQLYSVPGTDPIKITGAVGEPWHNTWLAGWLTVGVGLTVIVKVPGVPEQLTPPLVNTGVTVIVATIGALVILVAVNEAIFPVPLSASPIDGSLLVQL